MIVRCCSRHYVPNTETKAQGCYVDESALVGSKLVQFDLLTVCCPLSLSLLRELTRNDAAAAHDDVL